MNIDCIDYSFIDQNLTQIICDQLEMIFIFFFKSRNVRRFDDNVFFHFITHALYFIFIVQNHIEFIIFMLIISFDQHQIILNKLWMNSHKIMLNIQFDRLWFKSNVCDYYDFFFIEFVFFSQFDMRCFFMHQLFNFFQFQSYDFFLFSIVALSPLKNQVMQNQKFSKKIMILQRSFTLDKSIIHSNQKINSASSSFSIKFSVKLNVIMISVVVYHFFFKRYHKNKNYDFFFMFLYNVNKILNYIESRMSIKFMFEMKKDFIQKITLKKINRLLFAKFKNLL